MKEFELKYGCNPNQKPSKIYMADGSELPIEILSGRPGYINFLDAFNSWQLVKELKEATGLPSATSPEPNQRTFAVWRTRGAASVTPSSAALVPQLSGARSRQHN